MRLLRLVRLPSQPPRPRRLQLRGRPLSVWVVSPRHLLPFDVPFDVRPQLLSVNVRRPVVLLLSVPEAPLQVHAPLHASLQVQLLTKGAQWQCLERERSRGWWLMGNAWMKAQEMKKLLGDRCYSCLSNGKIRNDTAL